MYIEWVDRTVGNKELLCHYHLPQCYFFHQNLTSGNADALTLRKTSEASMGWEHKKYQCTPFVWKTLWCYFQYHVFHTLCNFNLHSF